MAVSSLSLRPRAAAVLTSSRSSTLLCPQPIAFCLRSKSCLSPPSRNLSSSSQRFISSQDAKKSLQDPHYLTKKLANEMQLPLFSANQDQLNIIENPDRFFQTLLTKIKTAQNRIFLASLYIGKEEVQLVEALRHQLQSRPGLCVMILTDALRSTREPSPSASCATLLASLARDFSDRVDVRLYHTPTLRGITKKLVGKRFNEGWGLQHMKIYGFDDDVIITGANLSADYFTNRKDRYLLIESHKQMANYFHSLLLLIARFSYALESDSPTPSPRPIPDYTGYRTKWDGGDGLLLGEEFDGSVSESGTVTTSIHSSSFFTETNWDRFGKIAIKEFTKRWYQHTITTVLSSSSPQHSSLSTNDTLILPLLQMGPLEIRQETNAIPQLFQLANQVSLQTKNPVILDLTSGYFSLYPPYQTFLTCKKNTISAIFRIICAAPQSNGFFKSKGISSWIPDAYTWLEKKFWKTLQKNNKLLEQNGGGGRGGGVEMKEWKKFGWTYHAKGIWYTPPTTDSPTMIHIGSSNYGSRSSELDLECTLLLSTCSKKISKQFKEEVETIRQDAKDKVDASLFQRPDRKVKWRVRIAAWFVKGML